MLVIGFGVKVTLPVNVADLGSKGVRALLWLDRSRVLMVMRSQRRAIVDKHWTRQLNLGRDLGRAT